MFVRGPCCLLLGFIIYSVVYCLSCSILSIPDNDIEEGQLDEEEVEELPEQPSTTTESAPSLAVTSSGPVSTVSAISEQMSSVPIGGGEDNPPPAKRRPEPIVWSGPSSCKCCDQYSCTKYLLFWLSLVITACAASLPLHLWFDVSYSVVYIKCRPYYHVWCESLC